LEKGQVKNMGDLQEVFNNATKVPRSKLDALAQKGFIVYEVFS
jgi:hypothetical protein